jgi:hypothetical protein
MHWVLDVEFKDDLSRYRAGHGAKNMAVVRRFSLGLIRADKNSGTGGVRIVFAHQRRLDSFLDQLSSRVADRIDAGIHRRRYFAVRPTFARVRRVRFE